ncbi:MAG: hypothetical protein ACI94Y_001029 [Maribacter sp.]|jgi:hypothetical protein
MSFIKQFSSTLLVYVFLFISIQGYAQFKKIKLGNITDEYKNYSECEFAPGSGAVILKKDGHSFFNFSENGANTSIVSHRIIKILNKDGLDAANIKFRTSGIVTKIKAVTYNKEGNTWKETAFEKKDLFKEKVVGKKRIYDYRIPMPNVSTGSVLEVLIEINHKDDLFISDWSFQDDYPVLSSTYQTVYPNDFIFSQRLVSNYTIKIHPHEEINQYLGGRSFAATIYGFTGINIPSLNRNESFSPSPDFYSSHVEFNLTKINSNVFKNQSFSFNSYEEYATFLLKSKYFGAYLEKSKPGILAKLDVSIAPNTDLKNTKAIYEAIQKKITWNEIYSMFPEKSPEETIKDKKGEVPDINMLLIAALREAKLKAFPLLASTRRNGKPNPVAPTEGRLNYLLCVVEIDGKYIVLDASREELPFGMLPYSLLNGNGYIIDLARKGWIPLQENAKYEKIYVANLSIEDDKIKGTLMSKLNKYGAYNYYFAEDDEELENLQKEFKDAIASDWKWSKCDFKEYKSGDPIIIKGEISKEIDTDDLIYIEPSLFQIFNGNPLKEKERINPVDIPYRIKYKLLYNLTIPEGYVIEESPKSTKIVLPDDGGSFIYIVEEKSNKLSINITFNLKKIYFSVEEYSILHEFFAKTYEQMENMIVLKKE